MPLGIGVDIESIDRFDKLNLSDDNAFLEKVFTKNELAYCFSCSAAASHLAARYAGKEAVIKALSKFNMGPVSYRDIEIVHNSCGAPLVKLNKNGFEVVKMEISLSHSGDKAIAFAISTLVNPK